jgi:hypothetical protein
MKYSLVSLAVISSVLAGCAGGGGTINSASSTPTVVPPPATPPASTAPVDERIKFDTVTHTYNLPFGETSVTYKTGAHKPTENFSKTEKYKIADYGFLEVTVKGKHPGCPESLCGPEKSNPGPWGPGAHQIIETDINGDGYKDFYVFDSFIGHPDQGPTNLIHAFINDGKGHFKLSDNIVFDGGVACSQQGTSYYKGRITDPKCGSTVGSARHILVADFNGDGMDDIFGGMVLHLSDKGKLYNKTLTNLPSYFSSGNVENMFRHDQYAGDATGDGKLDIFMPTIQHAVKGKWADGTPISGCSECVATVPWSLLVNDGKGNFSLNQNFPILGVGVDHPLVKPYMSYTTHEKGVLWGGTPEALWATTAAIADFNKDGFSDIAVGWYNPKMTETWGLGKNSAGAVYYNDGKNDWRNRPIVPLPANWYGANGNGNDMEVMDFDGDGYMDIVLASTKHIPYYEGRVIQFFKNNKDGTFSDVTTSVHPNPEKYANGTGTPLWNGEGQLRLVDFNHDGKLDIVDAVNGTYVLINTGNGKFKMLDHTKFPTADGKLATLFPVEIDGKWDYDFISYTTPECTSDSCTTSYYQVLDPPVGTVPGLYDIILDDFTRKPSTYTTMAAMANRAYTDLFYYSRWNTNNARVFSTYNNGIKTIGGTFGGKDAGLTVLNAKSSSVSPTSTFTGDTDAIGFYANRDKWVAMVGYAHSKLTGNIESDFFGTARSNTTADTFGAELSYKEELGKFSYSIGSRYNSTVVKGFVEQGADVNLRVADQHYNSANLVATLAYFDSFNYKNTRFFYGADVEYLRYFYSSGSNVQVSTGGAFTSVKGVNLLNRNGTAVSLNAGAWLNSNANVLFSVTNATKDPSYTVALGYRF